MRRSKALYTGWLLCLACAICSGQAPVAAPGPGVLTAPATASIATASDQTNPPSAILRPALATVRQVVNELKIEKWKRGTVRDEAAKNSAAIVRDIEVNLPPLMNDADTTPETLSKVLPMSRNVDALYDVLLRVDEASRVSAPGDQITQLEQALDGLRKARLTFDDHIQDLAAALEKHAGDLQATVDRQAAYKCPAPAPAPACVAPTPVRKKKPRPPAAKPSAAKPSTNTAPPATPAPKPQN